MEFDKSRCFTSLNADELKAGDKVIVADTIMELRDFIEERAGAMKCYAIIKEILPDNREKRFALDDNMRYSLAYLVERKENCANCSHSCKSINPCLRYEPKTEQKAEPHYRPFKDTDELIKVWDAKIGTPNWGTDGDLTMPHIWVRQKECSKGGLLITYFGEDEVKTDMGFLTMGKLLADFTFVDGTPCGVEE